MFHLGIYFTIIYIPSTVYILVLFKLGWCGKISDFMLYFVAILSLCVWPASKMCKAYYLRDVVRQGRMKSTSGCFHEKNVSGFATAGFEQVAM